MTRQHVFDRFIILSFKVIYCRCELRMSNVKNVIPHSALKTSLWPWIQQKALSVVFKLETIDYNFSILSKKHENVITRHEYPNQLVLLLLSIQYAHLHSKSKPAPNPTKAHILHIFLFATYCIIHYVFKRHRNYT